MQRERSLPSGKIIPSGISIQACSKGVRSGAAAGHWIRDTKHRLTAEAWVRSYCVVQQRRKAPASANSSKDRAGLEAQVYSFRLHTTKAMTGALELRLNSHRGACSAMSFEIRVKTASGLKTLTTKTGKPFQKLRIQGLSVGTEGLSIEIRCKSSASVASRGTVRCYGRASVRFDVRKTGKGV